MSPSVDVVAVHSPTTTSVQSITNNTSDTLPANLADDAQSHSLTEHTASHPTEPTNANVVAASSAAAPLSGSSPARSPNLTADPLANDDGNLIALPPVALDEQDLPAPPSQCDSSSASENRTIDIVASEAPGASSPARDHDTSLVSSVVAARMLSIGVQTVLPVMKRGKYHSATAGVCVTSEALTSFSISDG